MLSDLQPTQRQDYVRNNPLDGQSLRTFLEAGLAWLRTNQATVNALNVFRFPMVTLAPIWC